ncbi:MULTISPECIES: hypothetical protein [Streptomycetaceae]|uniref:Uncharacterized protein n=1 Tax=Streptantibioticus cattleyicolor (strain ATCC 35852 / DSM 46488 / JCM 4925 / NBRC 14057 / NRRL 8057) TaxID=1003195 RepID=F8JXA6_STREN|nr:MULTISPECIES: hypothetical protein [Streptomycetaceae]AEW94574.1 hypothetical protein SCATT_22030 [Streptantibioticus cattleyicolor NRRL 8057 = DSM 46488]MYS59212.1 hypothetical protein [Streptomyces sp. SID5468]CCB74933.1 protein of unknown function [Streptantibioticus cattleyicolor NRRL 8057 = DSM 46488]
MDFCTWCAATAGPAPARPGQELVLVGVHDASTGPPRPIRACTGHMAEHGIIPLSSHPTGAHTLPADRDGNPVPVPTTLPPRYVALVDRRATGRRRGEAR